jgi:hypothetical protein
MEIFERVAGEKPIRLESARDLESSFQRLIVLCLQKPGDYFAYDDHTERIIAEVCSYQPQYLP